MRKKGKGVTGVKRRSLRPTEWDGASEPYVRRRDLGPTAMVAGGEKTHPQVIWDDLVYQWVGIGWVCEGTPTAAQRRTLPIVVD